MTKLNNLIGKRFGRLVVIERAENNQRGTARWKCLCDCGNEKTVDGSSLKQKLTRSCGCLNIEIASKPRSEETKIKNGNARRGKHHSEETRKILSEKHTGMHHTDETKQKIRDAQKNKIVSCETRAKMSRAQRGDKHPNWQGGIAGQKYCEKWTPELRERIRSFFDYRCVLCGKSQEENGRLLPCHHVEYDKQACCIPGDWKFAALCSECHGRTNTNKDYWYKVISIIIDEIYNGKSYFTIEEYESKHALPI